MSYSWRRRARVTRREVSSCADGIELLLADAPAPRTMLGSPRLLKRSSGSLVRYVLRSGPLGIFAVGVVTLVNALLLYRSLQQQPTKSKANPADVPAARLQGQLDGRWAALHAAQVKRAAAAPKWPALGGIRVLFLGDSITMGFANHPRWLDFEALGAANFGTAATARSTSRGGWPTGCSTRTLPPSSC